MRLWTRLQYAWLGFRYPNAMSASIAVVRAAMNGKSDCTLHYHSLDGTMEAVFHVEISEVKPHGHSPEL